MPEPEVVVAHREHLWWLLAEAAQLEHMIMCQYLYAGFSLKDGTGDGLTPEQGEAVDRWRTVLHGIARGRARPGPGGRGGGLARRPRTARTAAGKRPLTTGWRMSEPSS